MKKIVIVAPVILTGIIVFMIFNGSQSVKIGYVSGTTGALAEIGVDGRNAFLMKIEEVNEAGGISGKPIEIMVLDDRNDPEVVPEVHKTFDEADIKYVVGHIISALDNAVLEEAKKEKIIVSASMSSANMDDIDDNFIRLTSSYVGQVETMSEHIYAKKDVKTISVVYDLRNEAYAKGFATTLAEIFPGDVLQIIAIDSETELEQAVIGKLLEKISDGVVMITPSAVTAKLCQLMDKRQMDLEKFSVSWSMTNDLFKEGGATVEGTEIVYIEFAAAYSEAYNEFRDNFVARYNYEPTTISFNTYEAATVLIEALSVSDVSDVGEVKANLISHEFKGLTDDIIINAYGDRDQKFIMYRAENDAFVPMIE